MIPFPRPAASCLVAALATFTLLTASPAAAQSRAGRWTGVAEQTNPVSIYGVTVVIDAAGGGSIDYHELVCGGTLTPLRTEGGAFFYRERITYGRNRCTDGGTVRVEPDGDAMRWQWFEEGGSAKVTSRLTRRRPAVTHAVSARPMTGCDPADEIVPSVTLKWDGQCVNGRAEGRGTLQWSRDGKPGNRYEGDFRDGLFDGRGSFTFRDGARYEGEFRRGNFDGRGVWTFADGARHEGDFRDDKADGRGVRTWASGARYDGDFRDGRQHGRGVYVWKDGTRYEGDYRDGRRTGRGFLTFPSGNRYEGEFRDGKRHGKGVYAWKSGNRYDGDFADDKRTGRGVFTWPDGARYEGDFVDGERSGRGRYSWPNGDRYDGEYRAGHPHGSGTFTSATGTYSGLWTNGCFKQGERWMTIGPTAKECGFE